MNEALRETAFQYTHHHTLSNTTGSDLLLPCAFLALQGKRAAPGVVDDKQAAADAKALYKAGTHTTQTQ